MSLEDRMARAEDYVFGLMDEHERERAERDMEVDAEFRDCVMVLAERLRKLNGATPPVAISETAWDEITERIAQMPQMAGGLESEPRPRSPLSVTGRGLHAVGGRRGLAVAIALAGAFLLGWLAGQLETPPS